MFARGVAFLIFRFLDPDIEVKTQDEENRNPPLLGECQF